MSSALATAFCLHDKRRNFQLNVRSSAEDRKLYFGRAHLNEQITKSIRDQYAQGLPPKKIVYGLYGSGKTHTLFNLKYQLEESAAASQQPYKIRCRHLDCEFTKKTDYAYIHGLLMGAIGLDEIRGVIQRYLQKNASPNLREKLRDKFGDANVAQAIHSLGVGAPDVSLWRWLCGNKLSTAELTMWGLTKNMDTVAEMVTTLLSICRLLVDENIHYLFLLDEMEGATVIEDGDAQARLHDGIRKLADEENDSIGFVLSVYAGKEEDIPEFFRRQDVISRIGRAHIHDLGYLQGQEDVEAFLHDLFAVLVDPQKKAALEAAGTIPKGLEWYPLVNDAKDQFVELAVSAPTASLPRNIIRAVNEAGAEALNAGARVIERAHLKAAEQIFREQ